MDRINKIDRIRYKALSILYLPSLLNLDNPVNPVQFFHAPTEIYNGNVMVCGRALTL
jgi:hypothetical protein